MRIASARTAFLSKSPATLLAVLSIGLALSGCSMLRHGRMPAQQDDVQAAQAAPAADTRQSQQAQPAQPVETQAAAAVEKIPFQIGVSSATVEKLARQQACTGGQGAGVISRSGPVEVYRMQCDNGKTFMARCELRQCKPM